MSIVYVLVNEAMPGFVKIGYTSTSVEQRMRELDSSGVPLPFQCYFAIKVSDNRQAERLVHGAYSNCRVRANREFFDVDPNQVVQALKLTGGQEVTPNHDCYVTEEDREAVERTSAKRSNFKFSMVGIEVGQELEFTRDSSIKAVVAGNSKIIFEGEEMSLTRAAKKALSTVGIEVSSVQGPLYWLYEGKTLVHLRSELEG